MKLFKVLWQKYKHLPWWKKILPFLLVLLLTVVYIVVGSNSKRLDNQIDQKHKKLVDEKIRKKLEKVERLRAERTKLKQEYKKKKQGIEDNKNEAKQTISNINTAVNNNDAAELERIRRRLNG